MNINGIIRAGLHARLTSDASRSVKIDNPIFPLPERRDGANLHARRIRTMIATLYRKNPSGIRKIPFFYILNPGPVYSNRELMFLLASDCTSMASDAFSIIDDEAVIHEKSIITSLLESTEDWASFAAVFQKLYTRFMRLWLLMAFLSAPLAFGEVQVQQNKMSANVNSEPLRGIVDHLKRQSGIRVTLDDSVAAERVTANFKDLSIAAGIKKMLEGTGINYAVLSEGEGKPTAVFIGSSEKPGAGPKKLDARPVVNRGVATPVAPPIPQVQQPMPTPIPQTGGAIQGGAIQPFPGTVTGGGMGTGQAPVSGTPTPTPQPRVNTPGTRGATPNISVPTAGGFAPSTTQPQVVQPKQPEMRPGNVVVPNDQSNPDEEVDEDTDEDEE